MSQSHDRVKFFSYGFRLVTVRHSVQVEMGHLRTGENNCLDGGKDY
jgi:hypothetical protein